MIRVHEYGRLGLVGIDFGDPVRLSGMEFGFGWYSFGDHLFSTTSTEQEGKPALLHLRLARNITAIRSALRQFAG